MTPAQQAALAAAQARLNRRMASSSEVPASAMVGNPVAVAPAMDAPSGLDGLRAALATAPMPTPRPVMAGMIPPFTPPAPTPRPGAAVPVVEAQPAAPVAPAAPRFDPMAATRREQAAATAERRAALQQRLVTVNAAIEQAGPLIDTQQGPHANAIMSAVIRKTTERDALMAELTEIDAHEAEPTAPVVPAGIDTRPEPTQSRLASAGRSAVEGFLQVPSALAGAPSLAISGLEHDVTGSTGNRVEGLQRQIREIAVGIAEAQQQGRDTTRQQAMLAQAQENLQALLSAQGEMAAPRTPDELPGFGLRDDIRAWGTDTFGAPDPAYRGDFWTSDVAAGAGNMLGFMATALPSAALGPAGFVGTAAAGAAVGSDAAYESAIQHGASPEDAIMAARIMGAVGITEAAPIITILQRIPGGRGVKAAFVRKVLENATEEGIQEAFQGVMENLTASDFVGYDPERGTLDNVGRQALIGAILGGGMGGASGAYDLATRRSEPGPRRENAPPTAPAPLGQPGTVSAEVGASMGDLQGLAAVLAGAPPKPGQPVPDAPPTVSTAPDAAPVSQPAAPEVTSPAADLAAVLAGAPPAPAGHRRAPAAPAAPTRTDTPPEVGAASLQPAVAADPRQLGPDEEFMESDTGLDGQPIDPVPGIWNNRLRQWRPLGAPSPDAAPQVDSAPDAEPSVPAAVDPRAVQVAVYAALNGDPISDIKPLDVEDVRFELETALERAEKGKLTANWFAGTEFAKTVDTGTIMAINSALRADPAGTVRALLARLDAVAPSVTSQPEAPSVTGPDPRADLAAALSGQAPAPVARPSAMAPAFQPRATDAPVSVPRSDRGPDQQDGASVAAMAQITPAQRAAVEAAQARLAAKQETPDAGQQDRGLPESGAEPAAAEPAAATPARADDGDGNGQRAEQEVAALTPENVARLQREGAQAVDERLAAGMPGVGFSKIRSGNDKGMVEARAKDGPHKGVIGVGRDQDDARRELARSIMERERNGIGVESAPPVESQAATPTPVATVAGENEPVTQTATPPRIAAALAKRNETMPQGYRVELTGDSGDTLGLFGPDGEIVQTFADNFSRLSSGSQTTLLKRAGNVAANRGQRGADAPKPSFADALRDKIRQDFGDAAADRVEIVDGTKDRPTTLAAMDPQGTDAARFWRDLSPEAQTAALAAAGVEKTRPRPWQFVAKGDRAKVLAAAQAGIKATKATDTITYAPVNADGAPTGPRINIRTVGSDGKTDSERGGPRKLTLEDMEAALASEPKVTDLSMWSKNVEGRMLPGDIEFTPDEIIRLNITRIKERGRHAGNRRPWVPVSKLREEIDNQKRRAREPRPGNPVPLYVERKLTPESAAKIIAWAKEQGFPSTLLPDDLHVTIAYSKAPVDVADARARNDGRVASGTAVEKLGDKGAAVLFVENESLRGDWDRYRKAGASWDHGKQYRPHITITYDAKGVDLDRVEPFTGAIRLQGETQKALELNRTGTGAIKEQPTGTTGQRGANTTDAGIELPEQPARYFDMTGDAETVPIDRLRPLRARPEGIANAGRFMREAFDGDRTRRKPISVRKEDDGTYTVLDGNSTFANMQQAGWGDVPVRVLTDQQFARESAPKFIEKIAKETGVTVRLEVADDGAITALGFEQAREAVEARAKKEGLRVAFRALPEPKVGAPVNVADLSGIEALTLDRALRAGQPDTEITAAINTGMLHQRELQQALPRIAGETGAAASVPSSVKERASIDRKMVTKEYPDVRSVTDIARGGFVVDTAEMGDAVARMLGEQFAVLDEGWNVTPLGYFDRKLIIRFDDGALAEIQIWPKQLLQAKQEPTIHEKSGHDYYEVSRDKAQPDGARADASEKQREIYAEALRLSPPDIRALASAKMAVAEPLKFSTKSSRDSSRASMPASSMPAASGPATPTVNPSWQTSTTSSGSNAAGSRPQSKNRITSSVSDASNVGEPSTPNIGTPAAQDKAWGQENTIFTADAAQKARELLRKKLGGTQLNAGIDPEVVQAGITLAGYHIEAGARRFSDYARAMVGDLGESVRPYLRSWYEGVRYYPGFDAEGMTPAAEITDDTGADQGADTGPLAEAVSGDVQDAEPGVSGSGSERGRTDGDRRDGSEPDAGGQQRDAVERRSQQLPETLPERPGPDSLEPSQRDPRELGGENPGNFVIPADFDLGGGTVGKKLADNLAAIRTLKKLGEENRHATPAEQAVLARYVGWGGLANAFASKNAEGTDQWGKAYRALKEMMTDAERQAAVVSTTDSHYTAPGVVTAMWDAVRHFGFRGGNVLEPTVGVGNFLGLQPQDLAAASAWSAVEKDSISAAISQKLYPDASVVESGFEAVAYPNGAFDLAIGNPPFGAKEIEHANTPAINGLNIHTYIVSKMGDHLRPGGVAAFVITHRFLDRMNVKARRALGQRFKMIGAVRLPNDAFRKNAGTDVTTDVIFLRKLQEGEAPSRDASWLEPAGEIEVDGQKMQVSRYFQENPDLILGRSAMDGTMYGASATEGEYTVHSDGRDLQAAIAEVIKAKWADAQGLMGDREGSLEAHVAPAAPVHLPVGGMALSPDGKIVRRGADQVDWVLSAGGEYVATATPTMSEITPASLWADDAREYREVKRLAQQIREARQSRKPVPDDVAGAFMRAASDLSYKADGSRKPLTVEKGKSGAATKAEAGMYALIDALSNPSFRWAQRYDEAVDAITAAALRKRLGPANHARLKAMLGLRNDMLTLLRAEQTDAPNIDALRAKLNTDYAAFRKEYGYVNNSQNRRLLKGDVGVEAGLESTYQAEDKTRGVKESAKPAAILSKRILFPYRRADKAASPEDALAISISELGRVDLAHMANLRGVDIAEMRRALAERDDPLIFLNPKTQEWEDADTYLSGAVKTKLQEARDAGMTANARALEKVQPAPKTADKIVPTIRSAWIPADVFNEFAALLGVQEPNVATYPEVGMIAVSGEGESLTEFGQQFKHERASVLQMMSAAANGKSIKIYDSRGRDDRVFNEAATKEVAAIQKRMAEEFARWAKASEQRAKLIVEAFNEKMNTHTPRKHDGVKHLRLVGANPAIKPRNTQYNGAWRMIRERASMLHHGVGSGKTWTAVMAVMERRRMGLSRKPMIAVPNHLVQQWAADFRELYPGARILAADKKDFEKANRRRMFARIATGDYDAIIVAHSSFGFIEPAAADMERVYTQQIESMVEAYETAKRERDDKDPSVKQIGKRIDKYREKLKDLSDKPRDSLGFDFKAMGVDYLVVDEAHMFKNLEYATSADRMVGMNDPNGSQRAFDLYVKMRGLLDGEQGGVSFLTGTPISNSLVEVYTMLKYLAKPELEARGIASFDSFVGAHVRVEPRFEYTAAQTLVQRNVMAGMVNLEPLGELYRSVADVILAPDLHRLYAEQMEAANKADGGNRATRFPTPRVKGGGRKLMSASPTYDQTLYTDYLVARMQAIAAGGKDYASIDNALWVLTDARKASIDIRTVDPQGRRDPNSKVVRAGKEIKRIYDATSDVRGTQLVFSDSSTPTKTAQKMAGVEIKGLLAVAIGKPDAERQVRRWNVAGLSYSQQWAQAMERVDAIVADPDTDDVLRDRIEEYRGALEDVEAAMVTADTGFSVYDDLRAVLVESGIPESEVAFIHEYESDAKKVKLWSDVNSGRVRVLIGSTPKMGAGTNVQERLVALHHMDSPWRPSDVEQREGRIVRQGNELYKADPDGFEVEILAYSTKGTSDVVLWQVLERKARALEEFLSGSIDTMDEGGSDADSYADFMANSTGNPVFRLELEARADLDAKQAEVGGRLLVKAEAERFLRGASRERRQYVAELAALRQTKVGDFAAGDLAGSLDDLAPAMEAAQAEYAQKLDEYQRKRAEMIDEHARLLAEGVQTKDLPPMPSLPQNLHLARPSVARRSTYAKAVREFLRSLRDLPLGRSAKAQIGDVAITFEHEPEVHKGQGPLFKVIVATRAGGNWYSTWEKKLAAPEDSSELARFFDPEMWTGKIISHIERRVASIADIDDRTPKAQAAVARTVDTTELQKAREMADFYRRSVRLAEAHAELAREGRENRFIQSDTKRPLTSGTGNALREAPQVFEIEGESYRTSGVAAALGTLPGSEGKTSIADFDAVRQSDRRPVIIRALGTGGAWAPESVTVTPDEAMAAIKEARKDTEISFAPPPKTLTEMTLDDDGNLIVREQRGMVPDTAPTDTPAFKAWFGDSEVVDAEGKPRVLYHGTKAVFDTFAKTEDFGFHFGTRAQAHDILSAGKGYDASIMPVYLSIQNPLRLKDVADWNTMETLEAIADAVSELGMSTRRVEAVMRRFDTGAYIDPSELRALIEGYGFDGVVYANMQEGIRRTDQDGLRDGTIRLDDSYIAFRPEQIKSTFNRGTWSPDSPRISERRTTPFGDLTSNERFRAATSAESMGKLRRMLNHYGMRRVLLGPDMAAMRSGRDRQAAFASTADGQRMAILMGASFDPAASLNHEVIHALRASNLFMESEWAALEAAARDRWMEQYKIADRYGDLSPELQLEEAIAEAFADGMKGTETQIARGPLRLALARIKRFFQIVKRWLGLQKLDSPAAIFGAVADGVIGRGPQQADMRRRALAIMASIREQRDTSGWDKAAWKRAMRRHMGINPRLSDEMAREAFMDMIDQIWDTPQALALRKREDLHRAATSKEKAPEGIWNMADGDGDPFTVRSEQRPIHASAFFQPHPSMLQAYRQTQGTYAAIRAGTSPQSVETTFDWLRRQLQDKMLPLMRAQQAIERSGVQLSEEADVYLTEETYSGRVGARLRRLERRYIEPVMGIIAKSEGLTIDSVARYLTARHAPERNAHVASINPAMPDGGAGFDGEANTAWTTQHARQVQRQMEAGPDGARLREIAKLLREMRRRSIAQRVEHGLLSRDEARAWLAGFKEYVPLKGFAETDSLDATGTGAGFNAGGPETRRAMGRSSEAFNPLVAAFTQAQEAIVRGEKNRVGQALYELAKAAPPNNGLMEVKTVKLKRWFNQSTGLVETRAVNPITVPQSQRELAMKIDGKEHRVVIHDQAIMEAMRNLGAERMNAALRMSRSVTQWLSMANTMFSPSFTAVNAARDFLTAHVQAPAMAGPEAGAIMAEVRGNYLSAMRGAARGLKGDYRGEWGRAFRDFEAAGGKIEFFKIERPEDSLLSLEARMRIETGKGSLSDHIGDWQRKRVFAWIERMNLAVDNSMRLAAFKAAKDRGWSDKRAASLAKNLTVNFNRRGQQGSAINAVIMFFNAGMQGLHMMTKAMHRRDVWAKYLLPLIALGAVEDIIMSAISPEDDDGELAYDKVPAWQRSMALLWGGEGGFSVPLPYGYNMFAFIGKQMSRAARGGVEAGQAFAEVFQASLTSVSPPVVPTLYEPYRAWTQNMDWRGRPIRPEYAFNDFGPRSHKAYGSTSDIAQAISASLNWMTGGSPHHAGAIDIAPGYLDHFAGWVAGGIGRFGKDVWRSGESLFRGEVPEFSSIPVIDRLGFTTGIWLDRERFYQRRDEVKAAVAVRREGGPQALTARDRSLLTTEARMKASEKALRQARQMREQAYATLTGDARRQRLQQIEQYEQRALDAFNGAFNSAVR